MKSLLVKKNEHNLRLDVLLAKQSDVLSRGFAKKIINKGLVILNKKAKKLFPDTALKAGDVIEYEALKPEKFNLKPLKGPLEIHFEDDDILVLYKPAGIVTHPSLGHYDESLVHYLAYHTRLANSDPLRPGVVHRLDKDTSGLLVVAKSDEALLKLNQQFSQKIAQRFYLAIVWGHPLLKWAKIDKPIGRHVSNRKKLAVNVARGKASVTNWFMIAKGHLTSLVKCELETGRTHQIRVHLSSVGMPILGDETYGKSKIALKHLSQAQISALASHKHQCLHAYSLKFYHPNTGRLLSFNRHCPQKFLNVAKAFNIDSKILTDTTKI